MIPNISIILVNLNQEDHTRECIQSLQQLTYSNVKIFLIDNGSTDGSGMRLHEQFPLVHFTRCEENLGFGEGNNLAIRQALDRGAAYVVLLNNDTVVEPNFLQPLLALAQSDPTIAAQSCKIFFHAEKNTFWYAGGMLEIDKAHGYHRGLNEVDLGQYNTVEETDFATGCMIFISREALVDVGFLDDSLFLYYDDSDWCMRARRKGYRIVYNPNATIWHKVTVSIGRDSPLYLYFLMRNKIFFLRKHSSFSRWGKHLPYLIYFYVRQVIRMSLRWHSKIGTQAVVFGLIDGILNAVGKGRADLFFPKRWSKFEE